MLFDLEVLSEIQNSKWTSKFTKNLKKKKLTLFAVNVFGIIWEKYFVPLFLHLNSFKEDYSAPNFIRKYVNDDERKTDLVSSRRLPLFLHLETVSFFSNIFHYSALTHAYTLALLPSIGTWRHHLDLRRKAQDTTKCGNCMSHRKMQLLLVGSRRFNKTLYRDAAYTNGRNFFTCTFRSLENFP